MAADRIVLRTDLLINHLPFSVDELPAVEHHRMVGTIVPLDVLVVDMNISDARSVCRSSY